VVDLRGMMRESSANKGNYKELAEAIVRYDAYLAEHMEVSSVFFWDVKINSE
jgi:hypothetical protein